MEGSEEARAVEAGKAIASALGLRVDDAVVLHSSNRIAVRLTPCEVLGRVAPLARQAGLQLEVDVAQCLADSQSPIAGLDPRVEPRVHVRDGFATTLWTYHEPVPPAAIASEEYAAALVRAHASMRQVVVDAPHFTDRVAEALHDLAEPGQTPELAPADRALLSGALSQLSAALSARAPEHQLLHGEPHPGNVLRTRNGLLLVDLETCCFGPVEFDIAHGLLPNVNGATLTIDDVCEHYPGAHPSVLEQSFILIWAMITTWRWRHDDELPNRNHWRVEGLKRLRAALDRGTPDISVDGA